MFMPFSPDTIGDEFRVHLMVIGKSPLIIMHEMPVLSPVLKYSSPNENGVICGATINSSRNMVHNFHIYVQQMQMLFLKGII